MHSCKLMGEVLLRVQNTRQSNERCLQHFRMPYGTFTQVVQLVAPRLPQRIDRKYCRAMTS
jgi:hypothetical protein